MAAVLNAKILSMCPARIQPLFGHHRVYRNDGMVGTRIFAATNSKDSSVNDFYGWTIIHQMAMHQYFW